MKTEVSSLDEKAGEKHRKTRDPRFGLRKFESVAYLFCVFLRVFLYCCCFFGMFLSVGAMS